MKKLFTYIFALLIGAGTASCNFLDVIPDETAADQDAFRDDKAAFRYLYSCYSYLPQPRHGTESLDLWTSDEIVTAFEHEPFAKFPQGNYTAYSPQISYWNTLFKGIRYCNTFLENIDNVPNLSDDLKAVYRAEATFLVAYYHFLLLQNYGSTILIDRVVPLSATEGDYPERRPYDECVEWIAKKFDEAIAIGLKSENDEQAWGRATVGAALAIKAKMYVYAASPLFNGGKVWYTDSDADDVSSALASVKSNSGEPLFNTSYDASKWDRAVTALKTAIDSVESIGVRLYLPGDIASEIKQPVDSFQRALRMTIVDRFTREIIWADSRGEGDYGLQRKSVPHNEEKKNTWNGISPTLTILEAFYSKNGLPIDQDTAYNYNGRYSYGKPSATDIHNGDPNGVTLNLNLNREPRFYAWVAYHNSYYEVLSMDKDLDATKFNKEKMRVQFNKSGNAGVQNRTNNYSPTGYLSKKGVSPRFNRENASYTAYPWPRIRLADLYLLYAEALIEKGGAANLLTAIEYIDKVRTRAGIPTLETAWSGAVNPVTSKSAFTQDQLRQIVRQERTIELFMENQRFWDVRRWLLGTKYFNVKAKGMNIQGDTDADFFKVTEVNFQRAFTSPNNYLMPIPYAEIRKTSKLVQNPGY